jgi:uncharacterized membrane protein YphA (DoxX/SURF4 family)
MEIILSLHSIVRWLIIIVALVAIVKFSIGWRGGQTFSSMDRGLNSGFTGLIDLQVLLGLIYLLWSGLGAGTGFPSFRIEHMVIMLVAAVVAHLGILWKKSDDKIRFRNSLFIIADTLIIIILGLARLPGGLSR